MLRSDLCKLIVDSIKKYADIEVAENEYDNDLGDLGMDSFYAVELANEIEDALNIVIDDRDIINFRTINQMLKYFDEKQSGLTSSN